MLLRPGRMSCPYLADMRLGADGELAGQVSINEPLIAMGEPPIQPLIPAPTPGEPALPRGSARAARPVGPLTPADGLSAQMTGVSVPDRKQPPC